MLPVKRQGNPPIKISPRHAKVLQPLLLQPRKQELALIFLQDIAFLYVILNPLPVLAHPEEIALLFHKLALLHVNRTAAANKVLRSVESLAVDAVEPFIVLLVNIAFPVNPTQLPLAEPDVLGVGSPDEIIVGDAVGHAKAMFTRRTMKGSTTS